jgi:polyferredoxin
MHSHKESGEAKRMKLLKASLVVVVAAAFLHYMIWELGGLWMLLGVLLVGMAVFAAYFWFALKD